MRVQGIDGLTGTVHLGITQPSALYLIKKYLHGLGELAEEEAVALPRVPKEKPPYCNR